MEAGAVAGVLRKQEHELIENVFELESRTVPSAMTSRESVVYFDKQENEESIKEKISTQPHSKFRCATAVWIMCSVMSIPKICSTAC